MKLSVKRLFLGSVSAAILGGIGYAFLPKPAAADLASVTRGPLRVTVDHEGRTRVRERFVISAPLVGQVARIGRKEGVPVEAGQTILAVIEPKESELLDPSTRLQTEAKVKGGEAAVKQAAHNLERAKEVYKLAQADLARAQRMVATQSLPQADYDAALYKERGSAQELRAAQFALRVAEFELEQAKAVLLRTRPGSPGDPEDPRFVIRAPVSGKVLRVLQESSGYVPAGTKLLEVGDPADLEVEIDLLTQDAVKVVPGARVLFEHWGGEGVLNGRVRLVEPSGFM